MYIISQLQVAARWWTVKVSVQPARRQSGMVEREIENRVGGEGRGERVRERERERERERGGGGWGRERGKGMRGEKRKEGEWTGCVY